MPDISADIAQGPEEFQRNEFVAELHVSAELLDPSSDGWGLIGLAVEEQTERFKRDHPNATLTCVLIRVIDKERGLMTRYEDGEI